MAERDSAPVDEVVDAVMGALRDHGYRESTTIRYRTCVNRLRRLCNARGGEYTRGLGAVFASQTTSPTTGGLVRQRVWDHGRCARLADSYLDAGEVDLSKWRRAKPVPAGQVFSGLLRAWEADLVDRGLAESTRGQCGDAARRFLLFAEGRAKSGLREVEASDVTAFLTGLALSCSAAGMRSFVAAFRPFLRFTGETRLSLAVEGLRFERKRAIMPMLSSSDLDAVYEVLRSGRVTARDKAMVLLSLTTGLRACDIVALEIGDIDWRGDRIALTQKKTGNPLSLPLLPMVGNAISEYLLRERPDSNDRRVFIRWKAPYTGLSGHTAVYFVMRKVFRLAGVEPGCHGTRLARHNAASRMLLAGVPSPTISAVLGHGDPSSADRYLETDESGMRACVLPLPEGAKR
jgi:integrase